MLDYNVLMITCLMLAAGLSERFGSPKPLAKISDQTVIERTQKMLAESSVDEIIVILGAHIEQVKPFVLKHTKVRFVYNKDWNFGQTSSFKTGLREASSLSTGVLLFPVDYPNIQKETIEKLVKEFRKKSVSIIIPTYQDKKGHPPIFSTALKDEFLALEDSVGINVVAKRHGADTAFLPVTDPGVLESFNTVEELQKIKK